MADLEQSEAHLEPRELADWLLSRGRHWVTSAEAAHLLDVPAAQVSPALARWRRRGHLFSPTKGAYVPIPPEFRSWGAVPAASFIDPLMSHLGHPYYVALLSAAELLGAAHQRPQVFQVVTTARLRDRSFGRVRVAFVTISAMAGRPTMTRNTPTGTMTVSTPEVTLLDLVSMPQRSGGLSNVATVAGELLDDDAIDLAALASAAEGYPAAIAQRTGWLLDWLAGELGSIVQLDDLHQVASQRAAPTPMLPGVSGGVLDDRWNVLVNTVIEPDL